MPPTLARRYLVKLAANIVSVPVYLVMEALLPRALGPASYGNYSFATSLFQQLSGFLDMGTSTCLYNSLSRRQQETGLLAFYFRIALLVGLFTALLGLLMLWPRAGKVLMPDVPLWLGPLAALWAFLTWAGRVLRSVNDALGATIASEIWRSVLSLSGALALVLLFWRDSLNLTSLFAQQYLLLGATALAYWHVAKAHWQGEALAPRMSLERKELESYKKEFFEYSHPLFVQALLSFGMLTAERWLLQWFDGSLQQGFFALSQKVGMACFLFVSAMTPLLMREFSIAWGNGDKKAMALLLDRFAPLLYALAAYFSCFTMVEGRSLVEIFGGEQFLAATLPVQIMALYPLHQAYGQIAGSIFHASGKTRILRNVAALECVYGLALAWLMVAPAHFGGLNLGATGLAIKTVSAQMFTVNLYLFLASRFIPIGFWKNALHQFVCVILFSALALLARELSSLFINIAFFWRFCLSGVIYSFLVLGLCVLFPYAAGLSRQQLREFARRFKTWL